MIVTSAGGKRNSETSSGVDRCRRLATCGRNSLPSATRQPTRETINELTLLLEDEEEERGLNGRTPMGPWRHGNEEFKSTTGGGSNLLC